MYVAHRRAGVYEEATNDCFFYASAFIFLGKEGKTKPMDETQILLERHDQRLNVLERDVKALQDIRKELKTMSETLVLLTTEMKHTNRQLARSEEKIDAIENRPWARMQQLITAIASALAGVLLSAAVGRLWV